MKPLKTESGATLMTPQLPVVFARRHFRNCVDVFSQRPEIGEVIGIFPAETSVKIVITGNVYPVRAVSLLNAPRLGAWQVTTETLT